MLLDLILSFLPSSKGHKKALVIWVLLACNATGSIHFLLN